MGPDQEYVALGTLVLAEIVSAFTLQVRVPPVAVALGGVVFPVTVTEAELVHPVVPSVTITVYVPGSDATGLLIVVLLRPFAGLQRKVGLWALVVEVNWACAFPQPSTPPVAEIVGGVVFPVTITVSFSIQKLPPAEAVTVKITVPGWVTIKELPVPRIDPLSLFHTFVPGEGVDVKVIVSSAQDKTKGPMIFAIGSNTNKEKLIRLSHP